MRFHGTRNSGAGLGALGRKTSPERKGVQDVPDVGALRISSRGGVRPSARSAGAPKYDHTPPTALLPSLKPTPDASGFITSTVRGPSCVM